MIEIGVDFEPDSIAVTGTFVRLFHDVYRLRLSHEVLKTEVEVQRSCVPFKECPSALHLFTIPCMNYRQRGGFTKNITRPAAYFGRYTRIKLCNRDETELIDASGKSHGICSSEKLVQFWHRRLVFCHHLITVSARYSNDCGIVRPICFAVFRLITNSNLVGCSTGRSAGFVPFRILST